MIRLATYNVEWFNALFDDQGRMLNDDGKSARYDVTRAVQLAALGAVFTALDADGIMIIEGPDQNARRSTITALETFARHFGLRAHRAIHGFTSDTEQEIGFLYDPNRLSLHHDPQGDPAPNTGAPGVPRFDSQLHLDLDGDGVNDLVRFSKPPLELAVQVGGRALRLIGVHAKSKAPHGAMTEAEFTRISIENRRKQLAECLWLRQRVERHLTAGDSVIVLGDFNDGPGLDEYEKLFGHSGVEIVLGLNAPPPLRMYDPHAEMVLAQRVGLSPTTARFWLQHQHRFFEALIDFIMVSPDLAATKPAWRIWHPLNDPGVAKVAGLRDALLSASDHFPVTIDLNL